MTEVQQLVDPIVQLMESATIGKIVSALINAQGEFKPAVKDAANSHFNSKYATLEAVIDAVDPALRKYRIARTQQTYVDREGFNVVYSRLIHESGEWLGSHWRLRPVKQDPQAESSALTYVRRSSLLALCGIAPEDDDGNAGSQPQERRRQEEPPKPEPSGREWQKEAEIIAGSIELPAGKRVEALLALFEEARGFQEMTPALTRRFTALGKSMRELAKEAEAGATG